MSKNPLHNSKPSPEVICLVLEMYIRFLLSLLHGSASFPAGHHAQYLPKHSVISPKSPHLFEVEVVVDGEVDSGGPLKPSVLFSKI